MVTWVQAQRKLCGACGGHSRVGTYSFEHFGLPSSLTMGFQFSLTIVCPLLPSLLSAGANAVGQGMTDFCWVRS